MGLHRRCGKPNKIKENYPPKTRYLSFPCAPAHARDHVHRVQGAHDLLEAELEEVEEVERRVTAPGPV